MDGLKGTEKTFLHLLDGNGNLVAQNDRPLGVVEMQSSLVSYGIRLPEKLTPGAYRLIGGMYDSGQAGAPRVRTARREDFVSFGVMTTDR